MRRAGWFSVLALAATAGAGTDVGAAAVVNATAQADAYVEEARHNRNFGGATYLSVKGGSEEEASYVRFSVSGLVSPATRAVLRVYATSGSADGPAVYATGNNWTEDGVTWKNRPAPTGSALDDELAVGSGTWVEYDVTPRITGDGTYSFLIVATSPARVTMSSREGTRPPELVVIADSEAPSMPGSLSVAAIGAETVSLEWAASTDDIGVSGYRIFEGDRAVATTTATAYTVAGLTCGTAYTFGVEAYDAAGNTSPRATVAASTTACPDTQAPSAPAGLTATAADSSRIDLAWQAATDDVGVVAYEIFRNGVKIATTGPATTYSDVGLSPGTTYEYVVRARDAAGNLSPASAAAPATTPPATSATATFTAVADSRVDEGQPATNFGRSSYLRAQGGLEPDEQSYLRFSLAGLTAPVERAVVRVYAGSASVDGPALYGTDNGWTEATVTWNNRPARERAALDDELDVTSGSWLEYDVTSRIVADGDYSFVLATTSADGVTMSSREGTRPPQLVVTLAASDPPDTSVCDKVAARTGADSNPGTASAPFQTAQALADALAPGETGCLRAGVYDETSNGYVLDLSEGGYTIRSYPGERAKLLGIIQIENTASGVTLSRLDIEGTGDVNTVKIYAADVVVERSDITNAWRGGSCMILGSDEVGAAVRTIVRRNRFHECGNPANDNKDHSIYAANLQDGQIVDNVFWNHAARAIQLYPNADRNLVAHNVVDGGPPSVRGGIVIGGDTLDTSSDNVVEHNVIAYATGWNLYTNWEGAPGSGNVARFNCVWSGGEGDIETDDGGLAAHGNVVADPLFVDRAARDYRLLAASLCLPVVGYDTAARLLADD